MFPTLAQHGTRITHDKDIPQLFCFWWVVLLHEFEPPAYLGILNLMTFDICNTSKRQKRAGGYNVGRMGQMDLPRNWIKYKTVLEIIIVQSLQLHLINTSMYSTTIALSAFLPHSLVWVWSHWHHKLNWSIAIQKSFTMSKDFHYLIITTYTCVVRHVLITCMTLMA